MVAGMIADLILGTLLIAATLVVQMLGLMAVYSMIAPVTGWVRVDRRRGHMVAMLLVVLGTFFVLGVEIWIWAVAYQLLGVFADFETALYFSISTFCTLGYGDVPPPEQWRVLAALEGVSGFLLIGWSTAYLIAAGIRIGPFRHGEHF
jgi:hypothetical protein